MIALFKRGGIFVQIVLGGLIVRFFGRDDFHTAFYFVGFVFVGYVWLHHQSTECGGLDRVVGDFGGRLDRGD